MLSFEKFTELAEQYNLIPVYRFAVADMETPVSVLAKLAEEESLFLLESVENSELFGRYSFIGLNPRGIFTVEEGKPYYAEKGEKTELAAPNGAFMALRELLKDVKAAELAELPPLFGGAVGFMGYETVNQFEVLPDPKGEREKIESAFMMTDEMIIFDNQRHNVAFSVCIRPAEYSSLSEAYADAQERLNQLENKFNQAAPAVEVIEPSELKLKAHGGREEYIAKVEKAREYIKNGEIIQVVLSQRFSTELLTSPLQLYRALRQINPSPYTFFLKLGGQILIGSSPETLCRLDKNVAMVRPIAGTRKRGATLNADRALADELLADPKERAEHLMLVDLGRNDLGRIATAGSVQLKEFMSVERYSHVMHLVSTIEAIPQPDVDAFDLVQASFPAGTLSGAPKVRAMELINELEEYSRGAYGGAMGYFSYSHNMDLAITIRTLVLKGKEVSLQAGAGVVFDSDPEAEYDEVCNKVAVLKRALELANNNLNLNTEA